MRQTSEWESAFLAALTGASACLLTPGEAVAFARQCADISARSPQSKAPVHVQVVRSAPVAAPRPVDAVDRWLAECCEVGTGSSYQTPNAALFKSWEAWAIARGERPGAMKVLSETLRKRGFEYTKHAGARDVRGIRGLRLKEAP